LKFDATNNVLVVGTRGRGAWKMSDATDHLFDTGELMIDFDSPGDTIRLVRDAKNPLMLNVISNDDPEPKTFRLYELEKITINGLGGTGDLIVDESNGVIDVPGNIVYHGGGGQATLTIVGGDGQTVFIPFQQLPVGFAVITGEGGSVAGGTVV